MKKGWLEDNPASFQKNENPCKTTEFKIHVACLFKIKVMIQHSLRSQPSFPPRKNQKKMLLSHKDVPFPASLPLKKKTTFYTFLVVKSPVMSGETPKRVASSRNMAISDKICSWRLAGNRPWVKDRWPTCFHRKKHPETDHGNDTFFSNF